jgi:hypothetical protein
MSDNFNLSHGRSTSATPAREVFSPQTNLRPSNERLTEISDNEGDYRVLRATLPAGPWCRCIVTPTARRFTCFPGS